MSSRRLADKLRKWTEPRADVEFGRYVRPLGDRGLHVIQLPSSDEEMVVGSTVGRRTFAPGTIVPLGSAQGEQRKLILGDPPPGRRGGSALALFNPGAGELDSVGIISWTPTDWEVGVSNQAIAVSGYGFLSTDSWRCVEYNAATKTWDTDTARTVHDVVVNSSTSVDLQVDVAATEPVDRIGWLEVQR